VGLARGKAFFTTFFSPCWAYMLGCGMGLDATTRRRWFGAIVLGIALLMLILGQTVFEGRLKGVAFLAYWLICFIFVGLTFVVAFRDVRAIQNQVRSEQRTLLESTLKDIETDARNQKNQAKRNGRKG
jgi:signal transduction histidine kinase